MLLSTTTFYLNQNIIMKAILRDYRLVIIIPTATPHLYTPFQ